MPETLTDAQKVVRNDTGKRIAVALEALASGVELPTVIAPEYDAAQTYAVGDLVMYRSVLYRCTTAITTPEAWTAAHWTAVTVADELADKYVKPTGGIPKTDLSSAVQASLDKADTAIQLGITGAAAGDLVRVNTVDANGKPTSWKKAPLCEIACNANLLYNWYFINPVNQRGQQSYNTAGEFSIDRWKLTSGTVTLGQNGITLDGTIVQTLEKSIGQTVVASALLSDGTMITPTYNDSTRKITITASNKTIVAAKLELGSEQTLAHLENGQRVLNEIPSFGEELAKCQRYYMKLTGWHYLFPRNGSQSTQWDYPVVMRAYPTMVITAGNNIDQISSYAALSSAMFYKNGDTTTDLGVYAITLSAEI